MQSNSMETPHSKIIPTFFWLCPWTNILPQPY